MDAALSRAPTRLPVGVGGVETGFLEAGDREESFGPIPVEIGSTDQKLCAWTRRRQIFFLQLPTSLFVVVAATGNRFDRGGVRFAKAESDVRFGQVDLSASTRRPRIDEWGGVCLLKETGSDE